MVNMGEYCFSFLNRSIQCNNFVLVSILFVCFSFSFVLIVAQWRTTQNSTKFNYELYCWGMLGDTTHITT